MSVDIYKITMQFAPQSGNVCKQVYSLRNYLFISSGSAAQRRLWPPRSRGFVITHNDAPQSVGILWTSDQLVAETST
jgi:hypothetical protein